jgi:hypothetical protein
MKTAVMSYHAEFPVVLVFKRKWKGRETGRRDRERWVTCVTHMLCWARALQAAYPGLTRATLTLFHLGLRMKGQLAPRFYVHFAFPRKTSELRNTQEN